MAHPEEIANQINKASEWYKERVTRESFTFFKWFDRAVSAALEGKTKEEIINDLSPWGCGPSQSNGVQAGVLVALSAIQNVKQAGVIPAETF